MITPRSTRLLRVPDLRAFQRAILSCVPADPESARATAVLVPTRAAAEELRRTMEELLLEDAHATAVVVPAILTRGEFNLALQRRVAGAAPMLTTFEREVLLRRAALEAEAEGQQPPFNIRAALVPEMLALYDELRRRNRTVDDFERLLVDALEPGASYDRGAARLLQQTRFLVETFRRYEAARDRTGGFDEQALRDAALRADEPAYRRVVVTVADEAADRHGLWTTDFDYLARAPGIERIDVIATDALLESGFQERLHDLLPGIEDVRGPAATVPPVLVVPEAPVGEEPARAFVRRDREEELAAIARSQDRPHDRTAIAFQRPLPYLYLARQVFEDAGLEWRALDALPLAGEPYAAAIDVVFEAISAGFTRGALIDLLRTPHLAFEVGGRAAGRHDVSRLNLDLVEAKFLGGVERLEELAAEQAGERLLASAARAARSVTDAMSRESASAQIDGLLQFLASHERLPDPGAPWYAEHMRARGAVLGALVSLRDAHAAHHDAPLSIAELSGAVRRWIEGQTFSPRRGDGGVLLADARAVAYATIDDLHIVGLTEPDWPEPSERSIFYPQSLLTQLGWPNDRDRVRAARARFQDLLRLPSRRVFLSTITLENDAIVPASSLLDDIDAVGLAVERRAETATSRPFVSEWLSRGTPDPAILSSPAADWLALRAARDCSGAGFHGDAGPRPAGVYAITRLETYLGCQFRYFAASVLRLQEEREEQSWLTPLERGTLLHDVFETFYSTWQAAGRGAITADTVDEASAMFAAIAEERLSRLSEGDRALERNFLLGSAASMGLGERAFTAEIEDPETVVERLLEHELEGAFRFEADGATREVRLKAKADRIDLLADGTLRVIDYKLSRAPDRKRALQLPIYGVCAAQDLEGYRGRSWRVSRAGYIAFKEKKPLTDLGADLDRALAEGQARLIASVDAIESGRFPVQPEEPFLCTFCPYPSVCRKDYVGDE